MPSIDYQRAAKLTETLEDRLVDSFDADFAVDRRTVLGGLGLAGSAALTGIGRSKTGASPGDDDHGHNGFGTVGEYQDTEFDPHESAGMTGTIHVE